MWVRDAGLDDVSVVVPTATDNHALPLINFVKTPLPCVSGHIKSAGPADTGIRANGDRHTRVNIARRDLVREQSDCECAAPMVERRQFETGKSRKSSRLIPADSSDWKIGRTVREATTLPAAWARSAGAINESLHCLVKRQRLCAVKKLVLPIVLSPIPAGIDKFLKFSIADFVLIKKEIAKLDRFALNEFLPSRHMHHAGRQRLLGKKPESAGTYVRESGPRLFFNCKLGANAQTATDDSLHR